MEVVANYGAVLDEYNALTRSVAVLDLDHRSRLCVLGSDRQRFLHGQVTNDVNRLAPGTGTYAALVTAKGKIESDLHLHVLAEEILLDFEPGFSTRVQERLERYVIADDVQIVDVRASCGLLSVQGPESVRLLAACGFPQPVPELPYVSHTATPPGTADGAGDTILIHHGRYGAQGFDLVLPQPEVRPLWDRLVAAARALGGRPAGWDACEIARLEAGIPRYGVDMDATTLAPETGLESRAISYAKGCYIGQEVIARIRTYGQVKRALRPLEFGAVLDHTPARGDSLLLNGRDVGYVTSAALSPLAGCVLGLGYVRKECNQDGQMLTVRTARGEYPVRVGRNPLAA